MPEVSNLSLQDIKELIVAAVAEAKKPDPETAAELQAAKERKNRSREEMLEVARLEVAMKEQREGNCNHRKENGKSAYAGQVHSDGKIHPVCLHCGKLGDPYAPPQEMLAQGMTTNSNFSF